MASDLSPIEAHVAAIKAALDATATDESSRARVTSGELGQHQDGPPRRILFVFGEGEVRPLTEEDLIETFRGWPDYDFKGDHWIGEVTAHVVAENHAALWALWRNLRTVAKTVDTRACSVEGEANLTPDRMEMASHLSEDARYLTQKFTWAIDLGDGLMELPGYDADIIFPAPTEAVPLTELEIASELVGPDISGGPPGEAVEFATEEFEDLYDDE